MNWGLCFVLVRQALYHLSHTPWYCLRFKIIWITFYFFSWLVTFLAFHMYSLYNLSYFGLSCLFLCCCLFVLTGVIYTSNNVTPWLKSSQGFPIRLRMVTVGNKSLYDQALGYLFYFIFPFPLNLWQSQEAHAYVRVFATSFPLLTIPPDIDILIHPTLHCKHHKCSLILSSPLFWIYRDYLMISWWHMNRGSISLFSFFLSLCRRYIVEFSKALTIYQIHHT
jgi:hypothetical protein